MLKTTKSVMESSVSVQESSPLRTEPAKMKRYVATGMGHYSSMSMDNKKTNNTEMLRNHLPLNRQRGKSSLDVNSQDRNINTYKQRIVDQRISNQNILHQQKHRSYSIDACFGYKRSMQASKDKGLLKSEANTLQRREKAAEVSQMGFDSIYIPFVLQCIQQEVHLLQNFKKGKFDKSQEVLVKLLNYSVDINDRKLFLNIVKALGDFHLLCENYESAAKFFTQLFSGALLQQMYSNLIQGLIGISQCCDQALLFNEGMILLKKGLDYAWLSRSEELELKIYDLMGKKFYRMGDMKKAKFYHERYISACVEPIQSPLRQLATETVSQVQEINLNHLYNSLSALFLVHLTLPVYNRQALPSLSSCLISSARDKLPDMPVKKIQVKSRTDEVDYQVKKLLKHWVFSYESDQITAIEKESPSDKSQKKSHLKNRKTAYLEFKMNQHLRQKGIVLQKQQDPKIREETADREPTYIKKQNLEERVKKLMEDPGLQEGWYKQIVGRVKADQRRKLSQISDRVRLGGGLAHNQEKINSLRHIFRDTLQCLTTKKEEEKIQTRPLRRVRNQ